MHPKIANSTTAIGDHRRLAHEALPCTLHTWPTLWPSLRRAEKNVRDVSRTKREPKPAPPYPRAPAVRWPRLTVTMKNPSNAFIYRAYRVGLLNDCRARLDPVFRVQRTITNRLTAQVAVIHATPPSVSISPAAELIPVTE
jgi:hypothetical protein